MIDGPGTHGMLSQEQESRAEEFRKRQDTAIERAVNANINDDEKERVAALAEYELTVKELEAIHGPKAHCDEVDSDLFEFYSDIYKSDHGIRPHGHVTRAEARAYLEERAKKQDAEARRGAPVKA